MIQKGVLKGPDGIRQRMAELQSRIDSVATRRAPGGGFAQTLDSLVAENPLSGQIGNSGDIKPMNPFGGGALEISPSAGQEEIRGLIAQAANRHGVEPALLDALVCAESNYNPLARSNKNAGGLTQLMPGTAESLGVKNVFDPAQNLDGGAKYLSQMIKKFGDIPTALAAYNAGPGAVMRHGGIPNYNETKNYVAKVMRLYEARKAQ